MVTIEGAGVELAYDETGEGAPVVLVHDMAAHRTVWSPRPPGARVVAYDRRGYGGSGAPEPYSATTIAEQAEDLAALPAAAGAGGAVGVGGGGGGGGLRRLRLPAPPPPPPGPPPPPLARRPAGLPVRSRGARAAGRRAR